MKKVYFSILALLCLLPGLSLADMPLTNPQDTITIEIGNSKKIIIWVDEKEDLAELQLYDINKMIAQLNSTVDSLEDLNQVIIITDEDGEEYKIEIQEEEEEVDSEWYRHEEDTTNHRDKGIKAGIHFNRKDKSDSRFLGTRHYLEFDLGMNNYLHENGDFPGSDNEQYAVRPWGSWFVGINSVFRTHVAGPLALQWGGGVSWYNFKFEDDATRIGKTPEGLIFYQETSSDISSQKSKLTASYLNLHLVPMLDFRYKTKRVSDSDGIRRKVRSYNDDAFRIGLGGYAGYRIGSHTKYKYDDGKIQKDKDRNSFYLNNWRYGVRLQIGVKGVDLFANYDLNELFSAGKGPGLHAISFGITI